MEIKKKRFVSDEEFHAALKSMQPWWDEAVKISAIRDEPTRRSKSSDFIARWSNFRNETIGDAWGRIYPLVMTAVISGKQPLETVRMLLEKHQARLASAWKQGCELTGVEPPLQDEIAKRDQYTGSAPRVVELLDALRQKLNEIRAAKPAAERDDFMAEIAASADTEVEKKIKWIKDVLFDYDREEGDFDADNRRHKREKIRAERKARKDERPQTKSAAKKGKTANEILASVPENSPAPVTPPPLPDPRVELEARLKDLEIQLAAAKANKVEAAMANEDEVLTAAMATVKKVTLELAEVSTELWALDPAKTHMPPVPDPRVELEARLKDLEIQFVAAKTSKIEAATRDDDEALTEAMAVVNRIAVELETAHTELAALNAATAPSVTVQSSTLERVLARVGEATIDGVSKEDVRKAIETFVAKAEAGSVETEPATRMVKKFLDDQNKRPDWIINKALNTVSKGTVSATTASA